MSLADDIREVISTAREETLDLHVWVVHKAWRGQTFDGTPDFVSTSRLALVEKKQRQVKNGKSGEDEMSSHYVGFLEPIPPTTPLAGNIRNNPVDLDDRIVLPDGLDLPVLALDGFYDGGTGAPFYSQVYLG